MTRPQLARGNTKGSRYPIAVAAEAFGRRLLLVLLFFVHGLRNQLATSFNVTQSECAIRLLHDGRGLDC